MSSAIDGVGQWSYLAAEVVSVPLFRIHFRVEYAYISRISTAVMQSHSDDAPCVQKHSKN